MNAIGANTWIWVSPLTDQRLSELAPKIQGWGFDLIELPVEQPSDWDPARTGELLEGLGLAVSTCAVITRERDLVSNDRAVIRSTQDYVRAGVDMAAQVGASAFAGPFYSPTGRTWPMDPAERAAAVSRLVESLRPLADYAGQCGVTLAAAPAASPTSTPAAATAAPLAATTSAGRPSPPLSTMSATTAPS